MPDDPDERCSGCVSHFAGITAGRDCPHGELLVLENGDLAAGILSNVIDERERVAFQVKQIAGRKVCQAWCPVWTYRELSTETLEAPWFKVVIAGDGNRDGVTDWQDAALLYRAEVQRPFRAEEVKTIVSSQIGFNASHLAEILFADVR